MTPIYSLQSCEQSSHSLSSSLSAHQRTPRSIFYDFEFSEAYANKVLVSGSQFNCLRTGPPIYVSAVRRATLLLPQNLFFVGTSLGMAFTLSMSDRVVLSAGLLDSGVYVVYVLKAISLRIIILLMNNSYEALCEGKLFT